MNERSYRSHRSHLLSAVFGAAVLVYVNSLWNGFAYDDVWIVLRNDRVHQLRDVGRIWLTPYWPSFGSELGLYRPLTIFAFALEWAIGGGAAWVFHLANVLLHAFASVLVFVLIERLFSLRAAIAGGLVFALHPLHTEAVANVVGQGELLAAIGVLAACIIYVGRPAGLALDRRRQIAIFILYGLALLAKESAVVLPGLLVLLDFAQRRVELSRAGLRRYVASAGFTIAMFCVILAAYLTLRLSVLGNLAGTDAAPGLPYLREDYRLLNAFRAWPEFVRLLFFPLDLVVDYSPGVIFPVESVTPMVALGIVLVCATVALFLATPWRPRAGLVAGWFVLTILPVSNFFFPIGVLIAERTLYLPSVAVCFLAGYAWEAAMASAVRETRRLAVVVAAAIAIGFGARTAIRNGDWDSLTTVWDGLARDHPESYRSQWVNALSVWNQGRPDLAEKYFQLAERIWPRDSQFLTEFGNFYIGQRQYDKAIEYLERSRAMTPFVPRTHEYLGYAYLYGGRPEAALATAHHANGMAGSHKALTYALIAGAYDRLGRHDEAAGAWRAAAASPNGDLWLNHALLARALARAGRTDEALTAAGVALKKTQDQPSLIKVVRRLESAIRAGCYRNGRACDPLEGWAISVGAPLPGAGN
ncbi:MAG: tetratricopeptide repeat protein [Gemmatimonadota bacterium]